VTQPWFAFLESNSTGTGPAFPAAARQAGLQPIMLAENPDRYPFLIAEQIPCLQISTGDLRALRAEMATLVGRGLAGIYSSSEYYAEAAARLASEFGLPGADPDAVAICRNKYRTRQTLDRMDIGVPRFCCATDELQARGFIHDFSLPMVIKPTTGSGSTGVLLCRTRKSAEAHSARILATAVNERGLPIPKEVLIEEYIDGPEFSVETFGTEIVGITRKHLSPEPDFVEIGHDFPAKITDASRRQLTETVLQALRAIGLTWGPAHTEVRLTATGPRIIEINPRLAGGFIPEIVRLATGFNAISATVELASGKQKRMTCCRNLVSSIRFIMCPGQGTVARISGLTEASRVPGLAEIRMYRQPGEAVAVYHDFRDRIGHVIAVAETEAESASRAEDALQRISVELDACRRCSRV
jgi:S-sulfo-L-cysteine synthase (3-phospho-L-serine-dependent)